MSGRVLAVANQKGGVGKTTTVINLGAALGALGHRVLLVDCDPQANTSRSIGAEYLPDQTLYGIIVDGLNPHDTIVPTSAPNLDLLPASPDLSGAEYELLDRSEREAILRAALAQLKDGYDHILLDCPPSLGLLTINALVAASGVLVPVQCEFLALEGVTRLMDTVERIRSYLNPNLRIFGLLMTMYDRRTSLSDEVVAEVRRHYPDITFKTVIPRNVRLSEAPSHGQSIAAYDPQSSGAQAYRSLAMEVADHG